MGNFYKIFVKNDGHVFDYFQDDFLSEGTGMLT